MCKKSILFASLLSVCVWMTGCIVTSVNPFYKPKDLRSASKLYGEWVSKDKDEVTRIKIDKDEKDNDVMFLEDKSGSSAFIVHHFKLGAFHYLDVFPADLTSSTKGAEFYKFHLTPCHSLLRVTQKEEHLLLELLDPEWIQKHQAQLGLEVSDIDGVQMITDPTREIQSALLKNAANPAVFLKPMDFVREVRTDSQSMIPKSGK